MTLIQCSRICIHQHILKLLTFMQQVQTLICILQVKRPKLRNKLTYPRSYGKHVVNIGYKHKLSGAKRCLFNLRNSEFLIAFFGKIKKNHDQLRISQKLVGSIFLVQKWKHTSPESHWIPQRTYILCSLGQQFRNKKENYGTQHRPLILHLPLTLVPIYLTTYQQTLEIRELKSLLK